MIKYLKKITLIKSYTLITLLSKFNIGTKIFVLPALAIVGLIINLVVNVFLHHATSEMNLLIKTTQQITIDLGKQLQNETNYLSDPNESIFIQIEQNKANVLKIINDTLAKSKNNEQLKKIAEINIKHNDVFSQARKVVLGINHLQKELSKFFHDSDGLASSKADEITSNIAMLMFEGKTINPAKREFRTSLREYIGLTSNAMLNTNELLFFSNSVNYEKVEKNYEIRLLQMTRACRALSKVTEDLDDEEKWSQIETKQSHIKLLRTQVFQHWQTREILSNDLKSLHQEIHTLLQQFINNVNKETNQIISRYNWIILLTITLTIIVLSLSSLVLIRDITHPIQRLAEAIKNFKEGNPNPIVKTEAEDEIGILTKAFNEMILHRQATEEALRKNGEDLKKSQRIAHVGSWRMDVATNQVVWTEELYNLYGFDPSLPPPPYTEHMKLFTPESWERLSTALAHTRETGIPYTLELETVRRDGSNGWMWVHGEADVVTAGKTVELCGAAQDITERKRAEEELRESREFLKAVLNAITVRVFWKDRELKYLGCNMPFARDAGFEKTEDLIGKDDYAMGWREQAELYRADDLAVIESGEAKLLIEEPQTTPSGKLIQLMTSKIPLRDSCGEITGVLGTYLDITERKTLEAQLHQAQKMESVGRLAGGVAHDFNNMLSVIIGNAELAMEDIASNDPLHDNISEIFSAAQRSADVTRQLLAFARKQAIEPKVLDLNDTIESMLNMLRRLIGEDIDLAWLPGANVWPVRMDPSQVDQILVNLCVNARDAIADVGKITIETGTVTFDSAYCGENPGFVAGDFVMLAVSDNGSGMDKGTLENLFEPFFTTKELGKGTGLGLATIFGIVKQNNSFINVYSEPGQGSTFKIYLPRNPAETESLEKKTSDNINLNGTETILLVEDELSILKMARMMLEQMGYKVLAASTPGEAFALAREHVGEIHLLMTDVVMPEMNGRDLAENLLSLYPNLKRLFMSGYTANVIAHHGVLDKGVQFIQKPFVRQTLAIKVREALDEAKWG